eukprot:g2179.t1
MPRAARQRHGCTRGWLPALRAAAAPSAAGDEEEALSPEEKEARDAERARAIRRSARATARSLECFTCDARTWLQHAATSLRRTRKLARQAAAQRAARDDQDGGIDSGAGAGGLLMVSIWPLEGEGGRRISQGGAPKAGIARDTVLQPELGDALGGRRAYSYVGQLQGQLEVTNKEGWGEWAAGFFKSRVGRQRAGSSAARGGPGAGLGHSRGGGRRLGRLLVEVLRARELDPEKSFDPYVVLQPCPGGESVRTACVEGGGAAPVWGEVHRGQFILDINDGAVSVEVEVWNAYFTTDEFVGHASIDLSVLQLEHGAVLLSGLRWFQLDEGGEVQLGLLFVDDDAAAEDEDAPGYR